MLSKNCSAVIDKLDLYNVVYIKELVDLSGEEQNLIVDKLDYDKVRFIWPSTSVSTDSKNVPTLNKIIPRIKKFEIKLPQFTVYPIKFVSVEEVKLSFDPNNYHASDVQRYSEGIKQWLSKQTSKLKKFQIGSEDTGYIPLDFNFKSILALLIPFQASLVEIAIVKGVIKNLEIFKVINHFKNLQSLILDHIYFDSSIQDNIPENLKTLCLFGTCSDAESIKKIIESLPELELLTLPGCSKLSNQDVISIIKTLKHLKILNLHCMYFTEEVIHLLENEYHKLRVTCYNTGYSLDDRREINEIDRGFKAERQIKFYTDALDILEKQEKETNLMSAIDLANKAVQEGHLRGELLLASCLTQNHQYNDAVQVYENVINNDNNLEHIKEARISLGLMIFQGSILYQLNSRLRKYCLTQISEGIEVSIQVKAAQAYLMMEPIKERPEIKQLISQFVAILKGKLINDYEKNDVIEVTVSDPGYVLLQQERAKITDGSLALEMAGCKQKLYETEQQLIEAKKELQELKEKVFELNGEVLLSRKDQKRKITDFFRPLESDGTIVSKKKKEMPQKLSCEAYR